LLRIECERKHGKRLADGKRRRPCLDQFGTSSDDGPICYGVERSLRIKGELLALLQQSHHLVVQVRLAAGHDVDHDQADSLAEIAGALDRKRPPIGLAILVAGTDELDGRDESGASLLSKTRTSKESGNAAGMIIVAVVGVQTRAGRVVVGPSPGEDDLESSNVAASISTRAPIRMRSSAK
jgi:hypothetical protein